MPALTEDQFKEVPDFLKPEYIKQDDGTYLSDHEIRSNKLKESLDQVDAKYKSQLDDVKSQLNSFEENKKAEIEAERKKALEEARSKGDVKAIEERFQQQMEDLEKRHQDRVGELEWKVKEQLKKEAENQMDLVVAAMKPKDKAAEKVLRGYLKNMQQVTEDGKIVYLDDDGRATSLDYKSFAEEQAKNETFDALLAGETPTHGRGLLNGSKGGRTPAGANEAAQAAKKKGDLGGYLNAKLNSQRKIK